MYQRMQNELDKRGIAFLSLNMDKSIEAARETIQKMGLTFPTYRGDLPSIARNYQITGVPATIILDKTGRIRFIGYRVEEDSLLAELANLRK